MDGDVSGLRDQLIEVVSCWMDQLRWRSVEWMDGSAERRSGEWMVGSAENESSCVDDGIS